MSVVKFLAKVSKSGRSYVIVVPRKYVDLGLVRAGEHYYVSLTKIVEVEEDATG